MLLFFLRQFQDAKALEGPGPLFARMALAAMPEAAREEAERSDEKKGRKDLRKEPKRNFLRFLPIVFIVLCDCLLRLSLDLLLMT